MASPIQPNFASLQNLKDLSGISQQTKQSSIGKEKTETTEHADSFHFQSQLKSLSSTENFSGQHTGATTEQPHIQDTSGENQQLHDSTEREHFEHQSEAPGHQVVSPQGKMQTLNDTANTRLKRLDSSLYSGFELNHDLNPEQLAAAKKMVETAPGKIQKNAKLKHSKETDSAMFPELAPAPQASMMDISDCMDEESLVFFEDPYSEV
jgi:hypothetical protein